MEFIPATVRPTVYDSGQLTSSRNVFQRFIQSVEAGQISLPISQTLPASAFRLDDIVKAHQLMEGNQAGGKIVVLT